MEKANGLSRRLDWKVGIENDNNNQTLIKEQWIHSLAEVIITNKILTGCDTGAESVLGVQYKDMIIDRWWKVSTGIIDVVKSDI